jgi:hypothetical protein
MNPSTSPRLIMELGDQATNASLLQMPFLHKRPITRPLLSEWAGNGRAEKIDRYADHITGSAGGASWIPGEQGWLR